MKFWTVLLALVLALGSLDADAARLGRGGSLGRQSSNVTQRYSAPQRAPTAPAGVDQRSAPQPAPGAPMPQPQRRPWGGILGGLAAGLGLAWLAHSLGFGAGFGSLLLIALVVLLALAAMNAMRRRPQSGYAYGPGSSADAPVAPPQYNPAKVGNDASARPWEQESTSSFDPRTVPGHNGVRIGSHSGYGGLEGSQAWGVPAGFDAEGFLASAKRNFVTLQDAWDRSDISALRGMMTDEMLTQVRRQIGERAAGHQDRTEVVMLEAQLLGIEELSTEFMASVEFSGMIREDPSAGPAPFREVWNMIKPRDGSAGWLVAGVQALQ